MLTWVRVVWSNRRIWQKPEWGRRRRKPWHTWWRSHAIPALELANLKDNIQAHDIYNILHFPFNIYNVWQAPLSQCALHSEKSWSAWAVKFCMDARLSLHGVIEGYISHAVVVTKNSQDMKHWEKYTRKRQGSKSMEQCQEKLVSEGQTASGLPFCFSRNCRARPSPTHFTYSRFVAWTLWPPKNCIMQVFQGQTTCNLGVHGLTQGFLLKRCQPTLRS